MTLAMERMSVLRPTKDGKLPKCYKSLRNKAKSRGLSVKGGGNGFDEGILGVGEEDLGLGFECCS